MYGPDGRTTPEFGGTSVVISGRRWDLGSEAVAETSALAESGVQVRFIRNDVSDENAVKSMVENIVAESGRLDGRRFSSLTTAKHFTLPTLC